MTLLCRVMGVKRSPYYAWAKKGGTVVSDQEMILRRRLKALFNESRCSLGSRRLVRHLCLEGFKIGRYRVRKLMKAMNLVVKQKCRFKVTTDSQHAHPIAKNSLNREFNPEVPNRIWASDITYVWTQEGWLYLAIVIDLYS